MKNLLILISFFAAVTSSASINIKSIELQDSTIIKGSEVSALIIQNDDSSLHSIEIMNGEIINSKDVKVIIFSKNAPSETSNYQLMSVQKSGGSESGG